MLTPGFPRDDGGKEIDRRVFLFLPKSCSCVVLMAGSGVYSLYAKFFLGGEGL